MAFGSNARAEASGFALGWARRWAASHLSKGMVKAKSSLFVVGGVDHLDVELGAFEGWVVEVLMS